jgi:hypothetical protein
MKEQRKTWDSFEIKNCSPDSYGKFDNWENVFFDAKEYEKRKIEETKQIEDEGKNKNGGGQGISNVKLTEALKQRNVIINKLSELGIKNDEISQIVGLEPRTLRDIIKK